MKTIILCGSPKGNVENSGTYMIAKAFAQRMTGSYEIHSINKEDKSGLLAKLSEAENIIFIAPNYIHSIPAMVLDFVYDLPKAKEGQSIGFILQSGYPESSESEIIRRFLDKHFQKLGYHLLGVVIKGECAGLALMPKSFTKLLGQFTEFGVHFEQTGEFDQETVKRFASPIYLSAMKCRMLNLLKPISKLFAWGKILKQHNAYDHRYDKPYLNS